MKVRTNEQLNKYTSFKIGGPAKFFIEARTILDFELALEYASKSNLPYFVLGGGTNLLVRDQGYEGLVIRNLLKEKKVENGLVIAETGITLVELNIFANQNGYGGFEQLATVPGTFGGAIYNNAHYGDSLLSQFLEWIEVFELVKSKIKIYRLEKDQLDFEYDSSVVKKKNLIVIRGALKLPEATEQLIKDSRNKLIELIKQRRLHQSYGSFNSGCMFQNVSEKIGPGFNGTSAGYLIEQCGLKGTKINGARISEKHGNFFINFEDASSDDILSLAELCQNKVKEKFNVDLKFEIKII